MATPMSLTTGVGLGALNGILIRSGDALQTAQGIGTVILDKTGTITHGKPVLTDVVTADGVALPDPTAFAAIPAGSRRRWRAAPSCWGTSS
jgi:P-type Cu+ transporter